MSKLSEPARTILKIIRSLQRDGRPRESVTWHGKIMQSKGVVTFDHVPEQIIQAELAGKPEPVMGDDFSRAIIELKTRGLIQPVHGRIDIPVANYRRPDGELVSITQNNQGSTMVVAGDFFVTSCVSGAASKAYTITPAGHDVLDAELDNEPSLVGYRSAEYLEWKHAIKQNRLSEAGDKIATKRAPRGTLGAERQEIRILYREADAIQHCMPKRRRIRKRKQRNQFRN